MTASAATCIPGRPWDDARDEQIATLQAENAALAGRVAQLEAAPAPGRRSGSPDALLLRAIAALPVGFAIVDAGGCVVTTNPAENRIWAGSSSKRPRHGESRGWTAEGKRIREDRWPAARAIRGGETIEERIEIECFDGTRRTIVSTAAPLRDVEGAVVAAVVVNRDVTREASAQQALERAQERLRRLSRDELAGRERERRHLARELHDEIGQILTATKITLQTHARYGGPTSSLAAIDEGIRLVDRALQQVRAIALELRPPLLHDYGLETALRWLTAEQGRRAGLAVELRTEGFRFDPVLETACFRIVQEALQNVVKHARAHHVRVALSSAGGQIHLRIRDDGNGFEVPAARGRAVEGASLGLLGMQERAEMAGGVLTIESSPGTGTEIHACFPLGTHPPDPRRSE